MIYPPPIIQVVLLLLVIAAALIDFRQHRIPNWLVLTGLLLGIALNTFLFEFPGLWFSLKGLGIALLIYFPLYLLRAMGAGDVKLMAAVGAISGPGNWLGIFVLTSILGGIFALLLVVSKGRFRKTLQNISEILGSVRTLRAPYASNPELDVRGESGVRLPHAVTVAFGTFGFLIAATIWAPR